MKSLKWTIYLFPMLLLALFFAYCSRNDTAMPTTTLQSATETSRKATPVAQGTATVTKPPTAIRIGIAIDQTGRDNAPGRDQQIGADLAERYFKSYLCDNPSTEHNFCLDFVYRDTRSDNETAAAAFNTLIYTDNVTVIIGPTYSQQAFHVYPMAEAADVPVIGPSTTADGIPQLGKYISRVSAPVSAYAHFAITAIATETQRVAMVYLADDPFTLSETRTFTQAIQAHNLTLALVESYPPGTSDFASLVNGIMAVDPDLVVISGRFKDGIRIVKQLQQANYRGKLIGGNGFNTTTIFEACRQACNGMYIAQAYNSQQEDVPINLAFVQSYRVAGYEGAPSQISAQMFTAMQIVIEALNNINNLPDMMLSEQRDAINQQLLTGTKFDTPLGKIGFDSQGEICQSDYYIAKIVHSDDQQGQFVIVRSMHLLFPSQIKKCL
jgi:branched-chain amino acid transport system substrate-binding protein